MKWWWNKFIFYSNLMSFQVFLHFYVFISFTFYDCSFCVINLRHCFLENKFLFNFRHFFLIIHLSRQYVVNKRRLVYTWTQLFIYACVYICTMLSDVETHNVLSPLSFLMIIILITIKNWFFFLMHVSF